MYETVAACRSCAHPDLEVVLSLGDTPLADALVPADAVGRPELRVPLDVAFCPSCSLVQLLQTVAPHILFADDYPYYSSFSDTLLSHSRAHAERLIAERELDHGALVVELASNDGYLLRPFAERGVSVFGIDPAPGPGEAARAAGIDTLTAFFDRDLAVQLAAEGRRADVVLANNVLAHVADTNGFVEGVSLLLADDGLASFEVPYVVDLVDGCEFDTIYHEHLCYFSVTASQSLFARHGLTLTRVEHLPIHGGSLRLYCTRDGQPEDSVRAFLEREAEQGITAATYYRDFAARVERVQTALRELLLDLRARGARIAAYGAAAKGATLLNTTGVGHEVLDFVVDRNVHKHGRFMPGVRVPICDPSELLEQRPDYVLLLAWNFTEEILRQQAGYVAAGGRFIVPIPFPKVLDRARV